MPLPTLDYLLVLPGLLLLNLCQFWIELRDAWWDSIPWFLMLGNWPW
jgi:hypothetical protein